MQRVEALACLPIARCPSRAIFCPFSKLKFSLTFVHALKGVVFKHTDNFTIKPFGRNMHYISLVKTPSFAIHRHAGCLPLNRNIRPANKGTKDSLATCEWQWERKFEAASWKDNVPFYDWKTVNCCLSVFAVPWPGLTLSRNAWPLLWYLCYSWQAFEERHSFVRLAQILYACSGYFVCCCDCGHKERVVKCFVHINYSLNWFTSES